MPGRDITTELHDHIQQVVTTLAVCFKLTPNGEDPIGFTNHDRNLVFDGVTYYASTGIIPSAVKTTTGGGVDNVDVTGILRSDALTVEDLALGRYDDAEIELFMVNYKDLTMGNLILVVGNFGEVNVKTGGQFLASLRSLGQRALQTIGRIFSPNCQVLRLGDAECKIDLAPYTFTGTVAAVLADRRKFTVTAFVGMDLGYFAQGTCLFTSGVNVGQEMEIKGSTHDTGQIELQQKVRGTIAVGDAVTCVAGCNRLIGTCKAKFNNVVNFRGFPFIPGIDTILRAAK